MLPTLGHIQAKQLKATYRTVPTYRTALNRNNASKKQTTGT